jgi:D-3-phosphoglycerate dehydrogenase
MSFKVLVADKFEPSGLDGLNAAGCDVQYQPDLADEALRAAIATSGASVLIVRGTPVTAAMLEAGALSLIVRAGAGYNTIDVGAASRRGIFVSNCPGKNAVAVAELTMALILAIDRRLPDNVADLRAGRWNKKEYSRARGLYGRTLGMLGFGTIGQEVARRAHAFGMPIVVWSRRFVEGTAAEDTPVPIRTAATPGEVAQQCDVLSIHLALNAQTRGVVDAAVLGKLKRGAIVVNTARGEIVDLVALEAVVRENGIRAGLDVFPGEPAAAAAAFSVPIASLPGVYGTHHIGASTEQAQEAIAAETVRVVTMFKNTGKVPNVVNLATQSPATHMLVVRHRDRPGVLAHVFTALRRGGINVQETENVVFEGAAAAVARINLDAAPADTLLGDIRAGNSDILDVQLISI